jgi:hypothetical protein
MNRHSTIVWCLSVRTCSRTTPSRTRGSACSDLRTTASSCFARASCCSVSCHWLQVSISLGGHEWVDAAVSGAIGLVAVPPVLLGTAYGIWKENRLDQEVWQVIDKHRNRSRSSCERRERSGRRVSRDDWRCLSQQRRRRRQQQVRTAPRMRRAHHGSKPHPNWPRPTTTGRPPCDRRSGRHRGIPIDDVLGEERCDVIRVEGQPCAVSPG